MTDTPVLARAVAKVRRDTVQHVRQHWPKLLVVAGVLLLVLIFDVVIVEFGYTSISSRVWAACDTHPDIGKGGVLLTLFVCWLMRGSWPSVAVIGLLGGHLFLH